MRCELQVDSSSSSSSSFIASGCSSPATLRRSDPTTRSLPMRKNATDPHRQPNRSISLQETHSGAALEELKEVVDESDSAEAAESPSPPASGRTNSRQWNSGVRLGTLCEDWSSAVASVATQSAGDGHPADAQSHPQPQGNNISA